MRTLKQNTRTSGFTLIEILLVLGIIGMLSAMLMPVFASVRERARQTSCASNLRQLGLSISLYAQDSDDRYPLGVTNTAYIDADGGTPKPSIDLFALPLLKDVLHPYTRSAGVWDCSSDTGSLRSVIHIDMRTGETVSVPPFPSAFERYGTSFQYHTSLGLQQVLHPSGAYTYGQPVQQLGPAEVGVLTDLGSRWHSGEGELDEPRRNVLFADGHVKFQNTQQFFRCWLTPLEPPTTNGETSKD